MADFDDKDIEIQNIKDSDPEPFNGAISTAGVPVTITPSTGRLVQLAYIDCNSTRHSTAPNNINDVIKFSIDGGTTYQELNSGESIFVPGIFTDLRVDTNANGTNYQVILWS